MVRGTGSTFAMGSPFGGGGLYLKATVQTTQVYYTLSPNQHLVSERPSLFTREDSLLITDFPELSVLSRHPTNLVCQTVRVIRWDCHYIHIQWPLRSHLPKLVPNVFTASQQFEGFACYTIRCHPLCRLACVE